MVNIERLRGRPRLFARLVGLSAEEFGQLLEAVAQVYPQHRAQVLGERERVRAVGGGRGFSLPLEARLLSCLMYYRLHVTGALLSCLFELDQSNLWRERTERIRPVLEQVLPLPMQDHLLSAVEEQAGNNARKTAPNPGSASPEGASKRARIGTLKALLEAYPELRDVCVDVTEQPIERPQDKAQNKNHYSGKSHTHTLKTQVTTAGRLVLHVWGNCPGRCADRTLLRASGVLQALSDAASPLTKKQKQKQGKRPRVPRPDKRRRVRLDRGYSDIEAAYGHLQGVHILAARKGAKGRHITLLDKAWNAAFVSRKRIQIEQNIGHIKNWKILSGRYRARRHTHQSTFALVAGLHNFRILGSLAWQR